MDRIEIVTDTAMSSGEDTNEGIWAGFLINGEMKWVENYDVLDEKPFPDHQPIIICHASEFSDAPPAPDVTAPVRL